MLSTVHRIAMNLKEHSLDFKPVPSQQPELSNIARVATRAFQILKNSNFKTLKSFAHFFGAGVLGSYLGDWDAAELKKT